MEPRAIEDDSSAATVRLSDIEARPLPTPRPRYVGRYLILRELGRGGMGEVYLAYDPRLTREVAVKAAPTETETDAGASLVAEARSMAKVRHRNLVAVYDVEKEGSQHFIIMEYIEGSTLRQWGVPGRDPAAVMALLSQVADGLHVLHLAGIVHGDVKPSNVLVGADEVPRICDFGLATTLLRAPHAASSEMKDTASVSIVQGTPAYMSPEQHLAHRATSLSDQYAFCTMAWELLTGDSPFHGGSIPEVLEQKMSGPPLPPAQTAVAPSVFGILARGLSPDPHRRWPSMKALANALRENTGNWRARTEQAVLWAAPIIGGIAVTMALYEHAQCSKYADGIIAGASAAAHSTDNIGEVRSAAQSACNLRDDPRIGPQLTACFDHALAVAESAAGMSDGTAGRATWLRWANPERCTDPDERLLWWTDAERPRPFIKARAQALVALDSGDSRGLESALTRASELDPSGSWPSLLQAELDLLRGQREQATDGFMSTVYRALASNHPELATLAAARACATAEGKRGGLPTVAAHVLRPSTSDAVRAASWECRIARADDEVALSLLSTVLDLVPPGGPAWTLHRSSLGVALSQRMEAKGNLAAAQVSLERAAIDVLGVLGPDTRQLDAIVESARRVADRRGDGLGVTGYESLLAARAPASAENR